MARSKKTGRKIIIATFIEPLDVLTTKGVTEIMKEEAREEAVGKKFAPNAKFGRLHARLPYELEGQRKKNSAAVEASGRNGEQAAPA